MFPALGLTLALLVPGAPIPKDVAPSGPAPYILNLKSENDGKVRFTVMRSVKAKVTRIQFQGGPNGQQVPVQVESEVTVQQHIRVELAELKDLKVYTPEGKEVDIKDAAKKLGETTMAIASVNGQKVDPGYLKMFKDDVLVLVSPDLAPTAPASYNYPSAMPGGAMPAPVLRPLPAPLPPVLDPPVIKQPDVKKD